MDCLAQTVDSGRSTLCARQSMDCSRSTVCAEHMFVDVCVGKKHDCLLSYCSNNQPRNSSLPLGLAIHILRKMPTKSDESSVECYGPWFLIAARPRGV